jgi:hypothetical protein
MRKSGSSPDHHQVVVTRVIAGRWQFHQDEVVIGKLACIAGQLFAPPYDVTFCDVFNDINTAHVQVLQGAGQK